MKFWKLFELLVETPGPLKLWEQKKLLLEICGKLSEFAKGFQANVLGIFEVGRSQKKLNPPWILWCQIFFLKLSSHEKF